MTVSLLCCTASQHAWAQLEPRRLFIAAGTRIYDIAGGEVSEHASGLSGAVDVCVRDGELYVSEMDSGEITIATDGGDLSAATPFASGIDGAYALSCNDGAILVGARNAGAIIDATGGGDLSTATPFATGLDMTGALFRAAASEEEEARLWAVAETMTSARIVDATDGGDLRGASFATADAIGGLGEFRNSLFASLPAMQIMVTYDDGGDLNDMVSSLDLPSEPRAVLGLRGNAFLIASPSGVVYDSTREGDITFATGLDSVSYGGMAYVHECGDGVIGPGEDCDDGDMQLTCSATCTKGTCGDGLLAFATEECDDGNTVGGDGCDATCQAEFRVPPVPEEGCNCTVPGAPRPGWRLLLAFTPIAILGWRRRRWSAR